MEVSAIPLPSHGKHLLDRLREQRDRGFLCDCTVAIGEARFQAHRNVLAAFSQYFDFRCAMEHEDTFITSLDPELVNETAFQKLLHFVYTGDLLVDSGNVSEIYKAAVFLEMEEVVSQCTRLQNIKTEQAGLVTAARDGSELEATAHPLLTCPSDCTTLELMDNVETSPGIQQPEIPVMEIQKPSTKGVQQGTKKGRKLKVSLDCSSIPPKATRQQRGRPRQKPVLDTSSKTSNKAADASNGRAVAPTEPVSIDSRGDVGGEQSLQTPSRKGRPRRSLRNGAGLKENCGSAPLSAEEYSKQGDPPASAGRRTKEKPVCSTCGKTFSESSSLRRHIRIHKGVKPYECQLCGRAFRQGNQLKTHVRTHTGEKPYQCTQCEKGFAQKCQLVFHCRMHHGEEKPYKCEVCGLQFATSSNFKIHTRKHSGEKPYECSSCGKHFAQASTLTYHMRRHTGEKPYVCDTCGKAFAVSSSLITHSRKHTGETPYMCLVCGKGFLSFGELNKHFTSHTGAKRVECEFCGNSYTDLKYLRKHIAKVHKDEQSQDPGQISFPLNIPIDHQALIARVPPEAAELPLEPQPPPALTTVLEDPIIQPETQFIYLQPLN
ncbi:myoneurin isoform X1 [Arapaima gigas]